MNYKDSAMALGMVKVLGLNKTVTGVSVNGKVYSNFLYNSLDDVCIAVGKTLYCTIYSIQIGITRLWA